MATRKEIEDTRHNSKSLAKMAEALGYRRPWAQLQCDNGAFISNLTDFLDDNPGACQALIEWVLDGGCHSDGTPLEEDEGDDSGELESEEELEAEAKKEHNSK